jgi:UDP-glucose 4-epimerase
VNNNIKILITGANGYIGNCLYHYLIKKNYQIIGLDKQVNLNKKIYKCNLLNIKKIDKILSKEKPNIIIHFAAQSLADKTINKKKYYDNNVKTTKNLLMLMKKHNIKKLIFSSTAAIYKQNSFPVKENAIIKPLSNYAKTKLICEKNIKKNKIINSIILRFFNVCAALDKPSIGLLKNRITNLIPTVVYKALFNKKIYIYGNDYNTPDGTCIRDYIHIKDICTSIEKSIIFLNKKNKSEIFNIGNKVGISNQSVVNNVKEIIKKKINLKYVKKRKHDIPKSICNSDKARKQLLWYAKNSNLNNIIYDEINWIKKIDKMGLRRTFKNYI